MYRSGYATKHNQDRILKIKLSHESAAYLLEKCECKHAGGGSKGRVQWDPERDMNSSEDNKAKEPRKMTQTRSIQIGLSKDLSENYVKNIISIEDATDLAT